MNKTNNFYARIFLSIFIVSSWLSDNYVLAQFRILGGQVVKIGTYPYVVSVQISRTASGPFKHGCGGSLISPKFVMSAAHCFTIPAVYYAVRAGVDDLQDTKNGCMVKISKMFFHPSYKHTPDYDIALALLAKPVKLSAKIQIAKLPRFLEKVPLENGTVLGWGTIGNGKPTSRYLRAARIPIIKDEECRKLYPPGAVTDRMFCALDRKGSKDSCQGDSGGPLEINGTVFGVVSWGFDCGNPESPGVYARVSHFIFFINSTLETLKNRENQRYNNHFFHHYNYFLH